MIDSKTFERVVPEDLKTARQWIAYGPDPKSQRPKCPLVISDRTRRASTRKSETWFPFATACAFRAKYGAEPGYGIGFVFTSGLVYVDIDDALAPDGTLREWARTFVQPFIGRAYIERSPSGKGLHVIGRGSLPGNAAGGKANFPQHASGDRTPEVACFTTGKYSTITGDVWQNNVNVADCTEAAAEVWTAAGIRAGSDVDHAIGAAPAREDLPSVDPKTVPASVKKELKECSAAEAEDRSAARFHLFTAAAKAGLTPEEVFSLVLSSDWYTASGASEKGLEHLWQDVVRSSAKADRAALDFKAEQEARAASWDSVGVSYKLEQTKDGPVRRAYYGAHNISRVLSDHPDWRDRLKLNVFKEQLELDEKPLADEDLVDIAEAVRSFLAWETEPNLDLVLKGALRAARDHAYNPLQDYLSGLEWDGTKRLDTWLVRAGCEDAEVTRLVGRKWPISAVARALRPGCKVDTVLILEGPQGKKKSTLLSALAGGPEYFLDTSVNLDKDGMQAMHGSWITEIAELSTFQKAEQEKTKQFIAGGDLIFRPPYARMTRRFPRHFVLTGSTNDQEYFTDQTGNRRYWPVRVTDKLDVAWVLENRDQLLAEAVAAFKADEPWWFDEQPKALTEAQAARTAEDPLRGKVLEFIEMNPGVGFEMSSFLSFAGLPAESMSVMKRVGTVLRDESIGYQRLQRRVNGRVRWLWVDPLFDTGEVYTGGGEEREERLAS